MQLCIPGWKFEAGLPSSSACCSLLACCLFDLYGERIATYSKCYGIWHSKLSDGNIEKIGFQTAQPPAMHLSGCGWVWQGRKTEQIHYKLNTPANAGWHSWFTSKVQPPNYWPWFETICTSDAPTGKPTLTLMFTLTHSTLAHIVNALCWSNLIHNQKLTKQELWKVVLFGPCPA